MGHLLNPNWSKERRRDLRQESTPEEKILWKLLRGRKCEGVKFRRQCGIGPYIIDFFSNELRIALELDGSQHDLEEGREHDAERTAYLTGLEIIVLRFKNERIRHELSAVFRDIHLVIKDQKALKVAPFMAMEPSP